MSIHISCSRVTQIKIVELFIELCSEFTYVPFNYMRNLRQYDNIIIMLKKYYDSVIHNNNMIN